MRVLFFIAGICSFLMSTAQVSLIPYPRSIQWHQDSFSLERCEGIAVTDTILLKEAKRLQSEIGKFGHKLPLVMPGERRGRFITLQKQTTGLPSVGEAYMLRVDKNGIVVTAENQHGIFNGTRTLLQLLVDGKSASACEIADYPAFEWRGFMTDAARNFQSVSMLKQQIDVMAAYKMNIFHFHLTEDIAWRLQIKKYPQLTAPGNMERDKGLFYSINEMKDLIQYCKERHITLVPEIDMPGHSGAFRRAMKTDMQTEDGIRIMKEIMGEIIDTYDLEFIHIGGDEVKIVNPDFIPTLTSYIHSKGIKTIGWSPGSNLDAQTYRQLWMAEEPADTNATLIDSRHLYLNHMDPLESVVTIFHRELAGKQSGDSRHKGAILCMWHDRRVNREQDILTMNPVYPGLLAFAERSWRGGGSRQWTTVIGNPGSREYQEFAAFEKRLADHQENYFKNMPFPYRQQAAIEWKLEGPHGAGCKDSTVYGGTIILRHWWAPLVQGQLACAKENTTWYATSRFWSDEAKMMPFWIGFNNLSRSPATDSPPLGQWDEKNSAIWVNDNPVNAPNWKQGGMKGNPETPLIDEGYEYRDPALVPFRKGWNTVRIKLPIGSFKGRDWQNPVKWMFTFVPLQ